MPMLMVGPSVGWSFQHEHWWKLERRLRKDLNRPQQPYNPCVRHFDDNLGIDVIIAFKIGAHKSGNRMMLPPAVFANGTVSSSLFIFTARDSLTLLLRSLALSV